MNHTFRVILLAVLLVSLTGGKSTAAVDDKLADLAKNEDLSRYIL